MDATETLSTIAQLALGLVGFTGVVNALDHEPAKISQVDAYRLNVLIYSSGGAMFLALIPLGLQFLNFGEDSLWQVSNILHALFAFGFIVWFIPASQTTMKIAPEIFNPRSWGTYMGGYLLNGTLQSLAAIGILREQAVGIYLFGLFWLLLIALLQFRRMLLIHQHKHSGDSN